MEKTSLHTKKLKFYEFEEYLKVSNKIEEYLSEFTDELEDLFPKEMDMQSVNFLLYELLINVYKHSKFKNAYINIDTSEMISIILIDDGIGIPGSFEESSILNSNDSEAIFEALNGKTTDKEKFALHGRGLNSTARITSLGFDGVMKVFSGNGICTVTKKGVELRESENFFSGTCISLELKRKKIENIYEYLKYKKLNKINED